MRAKHHGAHRTCDSCVRMEFFKLLQLRPAVQNVFYRTISLVCIHNDFSPILFCPICKQRSQLWPTASTNPLMDVNPLIDEKHWFGILHYISSKYTFYLGKKQTVRRHSQNLVWVVRHSLFICSARISSLLPPICDETLCWEPRRKGDENQLCALQRLIVCGTSQTIWDQLGTPSVLDPNLQS